ncbi:MAG: hypothetical protein HY646_19340 [Acidobacteria bacterium]|nr:hypothetical protein [Acidobacteriota bacterium]
MLRILASLLLLGAPQVEPFKKEIGPLQSAVDSTVISTGAPLLQKSRAAYIEGYGVIVMLEVAFEAPQTIFDSGKTPAQVRSTVAQRRKDVKEKMTAFVKQRVAVTDSIAPEESLAIVIHVLNTNPADVPNLPAQMLITVKKQSPQQVAFREF